VLDCPKTDKPCALSTCCGPSKHVCILAILLLSKICNEHVLSCDGGRYKRERNEKLCVLYCTLTSVYWCSLGGDIISNPKHSGHNWDHCAHLILLGSFCREPSCYAGAKTILIEALLLSVRALTMQS
jgi:hypothetical protein